MANKKSYNHLYLNILQIGMSRLGEGLSFNTLKTILELKGYDFKNDCIELATKQWFYDSFHHKGNDDQPFTKVEDLEHHLNCNFVLKGDSCLTYINQKNSFRNLLIAMVAVIISTLAIGYSIYKDLTKHDTQISRIAKHGQISPINIAKQKDTIYNINYNYYIDSIKQKSRKMP